MDMDNMTIEQIAKYLKENCSEYAIEFLIKYLGG